MFSALAKETRSLMRLAPSSIEYSEWQCRCANVPPEEPAKPPPPENPRLRRRQPCRPTPPQPVLPVHPRTRSTIREARTDCKAIGGLFAGLFRKRFRVSGFGHQAGCAVAARSRMPSLPVVGAGYSVDARCCADAGT